jgi:hypothetical protein
VIQGDSVLAGYQVKLNGTLQSAIERFGAPELERIHGGAVCRATWHRMGLLITFYNLGGHDPCQPQYGYFGRAIITGKSWRTSKGIRLGDPERLLWTHYPKAIRTQDRYWGAGYWLVTRYSRVGAGGSYPGLLARTNKGRVSAFLVHYQAGGD